MQDIIYIRDELVLEAGPELDAPHILLRRLDGPGTVKVYLNEVRYLADAMCSMAAGVAGRLVGDDDEDTADPWWDLGQIGRGS
jgi:hypothetical protein